MRSRRERTAPGTLLAAIVFAPAVLGACGGSDGDADAVPDEPQDVEQLPLPGSPPDGALVDGPTVQPPDSVSDEARGARLRFVIDGGCGVAGEEISLSAFLAEADPGVDGGGDAGEPDPDAAGATSDELGIGTNVTAYTSFAQGFGDSVELVSRDDDAIRFRLVRQDIVALTASFEDTTLTNYFGAWPAEAPAASALKKEAPAGCLWSLRLPATDGAPPVCQSAYSRQGAGSLGQPARRLEIAGCETIEDSGIPIVELPGTGAAAASALR